ncbi:MAG: hypothetical protein ACLFVJ_12660 [Persicimonas sp.]
MKKLTTIYGNLPTMTGRRVLTSLLVVALAATLGSGCVVNDHSDDNNDELTDNNGNNTTPNNDNNNTPGNNNTPDPGDCDDFTEIGGTIDSDQTLEGCYDVTSSLSVNNEAHLTIAAGSILRFAEDTDLTVTGEAKLTASGTDEAGIVLTGASETPGFWSGVSIRDSNSVDNSLSYTTIEYAGGDAVHHTVRNAGLQLGQDTRIAINDSTFRSNDAAGLYAREETDLREFANNLLTDNSGGAAFVHPSNLSAFDDSSSFSGNADGEDFVYVSGGDITSDLLVSAIDVPYFVRDLIDSETSTLEFEAGATMVFSADSALEIWEDARIKAIGTEDAPVTFRGEEPTRGFWQGILLQNSNGIDNEFDYVVLEDAGSEAAHHTSDAAGLQMTESAQIAITNSTFRNNATYGLSARNEVNIREFASNTLTENTEGAAYINPNIIGAMDTDSSYTGNDEDLVHVTGGSITVDQSVSVLDVPYFIREEVDSDDSTIEIEAGATLTFGANSGLEIWDDARLSAIGTSDEKITFSGEEPTPGYWKGVMYNSSNGVDNELDHVIITDAGGEGLHHTVGNANLQLGGSDPTQITINNLEISNGASHGISTNNNVTLNGCSGVNFSSNAEADFGGDGPTC